MTEEFVAVYRMHPLIPDEFSLRSLEDDRELKNVTLPEVGALQVRERLAEMSMSDLMYSFGTLHPGAITLHNFPKFLQHFDRADGTLIDLAAIDILRTRERGVPRYNQFRRLFHLAPASTFEEMTDNPAWAEELRRIYGDVERVDLMIGMYAEPKPKGFGFSDTAFRVFILMASRRLEERPLLHARLPARGLHEGRDRLGRAELDALRAPAALSRPRAGVARCREPVRTVAARGSGLTPPWRGHRFTTPPASLSPGSGFSTARPACSRPACSHGAWRSRARPGRWATRSACSGSVRS